VVRILIQKLKSPNSSSEAADYWKATKAALFLFPLLGGTYIIFLISPPKGSFGEILFVYINTILQSFQVRLSLKVNVNCKHEFKLILS